MSAAKTATSTEATESPGNKLLRQFASHIPIGHNLYAVTLNSGKVRIFSTVKDEGFVLPQEFERHIRISDSLSYLNYGGLIGIFSSSLRNWVVPLEFDFVELVTGSLVNFKVRKGGKFGIYSTQTHKFIAPLQFDRLQNGPAENLFQVWHDQLCGLYSTLRGEYLVPANFEGISRETGTTFKVWKGSKVGLYNTGDGTTVWQ